MTGLAGVDIPNERDGKDMYISPSVILRCNDDLYACSKSWRLGRSASPRTWPLRAVSTPMMLASPRDSGLVSGLLAPSALPVR